MEDVAFAGDALPLLRSGVEYDAEVAWKLVHDALVAGLPGKPWKGREC